MTDLNRTALPSRTDGTVEKTDTLVVGAGQAGVAMSEHLSRLGVPHLVLERNRIAEAWRSGRWDSLVANGPAWHDRALARFGRQWQARLGLPLGATGAMLLGTVLDELERRGEATGLVTLGSRIDYALLAAGEPGMRMQA